MNPANDGLTRRGTAVLLALIACLLLLRLGTVPLTGPDEPRYARVAIEMKRSGDWGTPTLQGEPWLEKPALYYWAAAASTAVFGETEVAVRLPSVMACIGWVLAIALVGARLYGGRTGLHAGFILGTSMLGFIYGRAAAMDMLLAACVTGATGLFGLVLLGRAGQRAVLGAYALTALAVLAKGPLGLLLPALVVGTHLAIARDRAALRRIAALRGMGLFLAMTAPWYLYILVTQQQAFLEVFVFNHHVLRFFSTIHQHPGPFYYYFPVLLGSLFPWSGLTIPALIALAPRRALDDRFVLLWLLVPLAFFSAAASKLPGYILPCLPPLALLTARFVTRALDEPDPRALRVPLRIAGLVGLVAGSLAAATPLMLLRRGEAVWPLLLPPGLWALLVTFLFARRVGRDLLGSFHLLRVGAVGFLLLLTLVAPQLLAHLESGRDVFAHAKGEEVLVWGARRTVWMSGYFYNDARVREVARLEEVLAAVEERPRLLLCGPRQRPRIAAAALEVQEIAAGPRGAVLMRLAPRPPAPVVTRVASPS